MTIQSGDRIPEGKLKVMGKDGPTNVEASELLGQGRVVLFSVPGAFTPTCEAKHLPGFIEKAGALKDRGVEQARVPRSQRRIRDERIDQSRNQRGGGTIEPQSFI